METPRLDRTAYDVLQVQPDAHPDVVHAAYRALARLLHPDVRRQTGADQQMVELNRVYAQVATPEARTAYDRVLATAGRSLAPSVPCDPGRPSSPPNTGSDSRPLDFGRYAGWTIAQLAKHDTEYLRWLRRHSSGIRYRREIDDRLAAMTPREAHPQSPISSSRPRRSGGPV